VLIVLLLAWGCTSLGLLKERGNELTVYRFYTHLDLDRWLLLLLIGVCIGLIAALLKQSIQALRAVQWEATKSYLKVGLYLT